MSIDEQELRAIAYLAIRVRKATFGCAPWDELGLMANLRKIQNRNLHLTIEHVMRHAADPNAKSPGVLAGSFTPEAPKAERYTPPKKHQECKIHPGQWASSCGGCRSTELAGDGPDKPPAKSTGGVRATAAFKAERKRIRGGA